MKSIIRVVVISFLFTCFMVEGFAAKPTPAEDMIRCVPDGTIVYFASSGSDSVGDDFKKTALGQMITDPQVKSIFSTFWDKGIEQAEKQGGDENVKAAKLAIELARLVTRRPFIAGISENADGGNVPVSGFIIADAAPVRKNINRILKELESFDKNDKIFKKLVGPCRMKVVKICKDQYAYWGFAGKKFVIAFCDKEGRVLKNVFWPSKGLPAHLTRVPKSCDALVFNCDYQAILSLLDKYMKKSAPKEYEMVMSLYEDLGINGLGNITGRLGFAGPDIVFDEAVDLPEPRKGLYTCYNKLDMSIFNYVEPQAMKAGAVDMDFPKFCDLFIDSYKKVLPKNELKMITGQITAAEKMLDVDIRNGILKSFSGKGVYYMIPAGVMMQSPGGGFVAIAKMTDDGAKFEKNMNAIGNFAAGKANGMLQMSTVPKGDAVIHVWNMAPLAMMQIMPCWAVVDGNVVMASNPVLCGKAIDRLKSEDPAKGSLASTESFKAVAKGLPENILSFEYTDSKIYLSQMAMQANKIWPMISMAAAQQKVKLPGMLPNFENAFKDLKPTASYSWMDKKGMYSHYKGSGVEIGSAAAVGAVVGGVASQRFTQTKKAALKTVSTSNLKQISVACMAYAEDNDGKLPPSLNDPNLLKYIGTSNQKVLLSPRRPKTFVGPSYIYVKGLSFEMGNAGSVIVAYENPEYLCNSTVVAFLDGHIERMDGKSFIKKLNETYERMGKKAPKIKFRQQIQMEEQQKKQDEKFQKQLKESKEKIKKQQQQKQIILEQEKKKKQLQQKQEAEKVKEEKKSQPEQVEPKMKKPNKKKGPKAVA